MKLGRGKEKNTERDEEKIGGEACREGVQGERRGRIKEKGERIEQHNIK